MNRIIRAAIRDRKVTILLSLFILLFGAYSYYVIPKQENPDTSSPAAQILTIHPGASSADIEELITKPIEDVVATLDGINYIKSFSYDNASIVIVMLNYDVVYEDEWEKLRTGMDDVKDSLPTGSIPPEVKIDMTESSGLILSLSGDNYNYDQLAELAEQYKEELDMVAGIKTVKVEGKPDKDLIVDIDNEKLLPYKVGIKDIYDLIRAQNVVIPPGAIKTESGKINLKAPQSITSTKDIENLIIYISEEDGSLVRLKDVAQVYFEYDQEGLKFRSEGKKAVLLTGTFKTNENVILIGKEVRRKIDTLKAQMPEDLEVNEVLFLPDDVDVSVSNFISNLMQGVILVIIVVLFGMGKRNAVIVSVTIPLSIAITFLVMKIFGYDIQQVSIAALIISLGILVDNSIVISDAIQVKINAGEDRLRASYEGTVEQAGPVFSSTLTTIAAFAPLVVLPGAAGEFTETLPIVVMVSLVASYIVAMVVTPALASLFFKPMDEKKDRLGFVKNWYHGLLEMNLNRPKTAMVVIVIIFIAVMTSAIYIEVKLFPYVDKDIIYFDLQSEISGDITKNEAFIESVEEMLREEPEIQTISSSVGGGLPRFYMTAGIIIPSDDRGQILSKFDLSKGGRFADREALAIYLQDRFDKELTGGYCTVNLLEINMPGPTIDVRLSGKNDEDIVRVSDEVFEKLSNMHGTMDVQNDKGTYRYEYELDVDEDKASAFGLTKYDIQYQINLALNGSNASVLKVDGKEYDIKVKATIEDIDDIKNLPIKSQYTNEKILVKQFARVVLDKQLTAIKRYNRETLVSVTARVRPEYGSSSLQKEIEDFINNEVDTQGVKISYGGDSETITTYLTGLVSAGLIALIAVYIILLIQFNSLKQPVIILATIPLSFIGVALALLLSGTHFTFTVGLGVASLFGIVVNNAILLIEYINRARKQNMSVKEACVDSVNKRLRPILLSSVTTIFGLVPLVRAQSSFFTPLAIALIGGLLISTLLTLTVIPTIYYLLERNFDGKTKKVDFSVLDEL